MSWSSGHKKINTVLECEIFFSLCPSPPPRYHENVNFNLKDGAQKGTFYPYHALSSTLKSLLLKRRMLEICFAS